MDPFSLTTGIVGLAQGLSGLVTLAAQLRESIEKVSRNRQKAKQLATDIHQIVKTLHAFHAKYVEVFVEHQDLQDIVADLRTSLTGILEKCKEMDPEPERGTFRRGMIGLRAWLKRDELEARLTDLNNRAQQCQIKFMTLATLSNNVTGRTISAGIARIEASVSTIHHRVVVRRLSTDSADRGGSWLRNVDLVESSIVPSSSAAILKSPDPYLSDGDGITHAFLSFKVKNTDTLVSQLLQNPTMLFPSSSPKPDGPTHRRTRLQLNISWEMVQDYTARESMELIHTIHQANSSTPIIGNLGVMLTHLGYRYEHLGMHDEALTLSTLAIKFDRLALEVYPHLEIFQRNLATDLENQALLLLSCGSRVVEATQCMIESVSIERHLVAQLPHPGRKVDLANSLQMSARLSRRSGDLDTAESHSAESLNILLEILDIPAGAIPDPTALPLADWSAVEEDGVVVVKEWRDRAILLCAVVLYVRFRCALARQSFSDAYKYASASRRIFQGIANHHPRSHLDTLLDITKESLKDWATPFRSDVETIALYTDAINYTALIPLREGNSVADVLLERYTLQAKLSIRLYEVVDPLALEAQRAASRYWDQYYTYSRQKVRVADLSTDQMPTMMFLEQVRLYHAASQKQYCDSTLINFHAHSPNPISDDTTFTIAGWANEPIYRQAEAMGQWLGDSWSASLSLCRRGPDEDAHLRRCCQSAAAIAFSFGLLGNLDGAHRAARRVIDTASSTIASASVPPYATDIRRYVWKAVWLGVVSMALFACFPLVHIPRSLPIIQELLALAKSLFPADEPLCTPPDLGIGAAACFRMIEGILRLYCRQIQCLRRMDESLAISESNLEWYAARLPPSTRFNSPHIEFIRDLAHNLIYAGQWSTALTHTTTTCDALVSNPSLYVDDQWSLALLDHCSTLIELGRVEEAGQCMQQGIEALGSVDGGDTSWWEQRMLVRKTAIASFLQKDMADQVEKVDLSTASGHGICLDASVIFADMGDHQQATKHAQRALSSIESFILEDHTQWRYFRYMQERTECIIALAVALILGGDIQHASELFPSLFDIYKKELQYQRNLYPGYAVALRLAGWVFDKVGKVEEGKKMVNREVGLKYRLDGEEDEETLRVVRTRLEREEGRPAVRRVREMLGVVPYQPEPATE